MRNRTPLLSTASTVGTRVDEAQPRSDNRARRILLIVNLFRSKRMTGMADVGNRLKGAFEQLEDGNVSLELADLCELEFCVGPGGTSVRSPWLGLDIAEFDLAIFLGFGAVVERGIAAAHYLRAKGVPVIGTYMLTQGMGKLAGSMERAVAGLPVPQTLAGPADTLWDLCETKRLFGLPMILKADLAKAGNNNFLVRTREEFDSCLRAASHAGHDMLAQEYVPNDGDYRLHVMGGVVRVAILRRAAHGSHLNNLSKGATGTLVSIDDLPPRLVEDAVRATAIARNEMSGVDVIVNRETGQHYILEINRGPPLTQDPFPDQKMAAFVAMIDDAISARYG